ncbi:M56 family metallopeptidase [Streptomyces sp. NBC_01795]|uniref:M56 family metallopeptidase n=1 Tax=unclassified Streptomyces TaxID=2593676 RepID=UPI002DDBEC84|nr:MULTISPECIES: M56 family metallopeptidase [unclassified Streptomyces]WSA91150.1 M56 family metallopeptidase [Streptomyces sp. NBC_01795]WSS16242.1 M56 family metallopeptidase [Streptomyces sp. NBC_01186]
MGVFVFLPLVLPLSALPMVRVAAQHLHPRSATRLLTALGCVLALCSTLCLVLLMVVGTAQLPGNPLPDGWADPEVRAVVPYAGVTGTTAIAALALVVAVCWLTVHRHRRVRARVHEALAGLPAGPDDGDLTVLPDAEPYAYALPGTSRAPGRVVASTGMLGALDEDEGAALLAHERAHLRGRHHRCLLATRLAGCANPLLLPLREAVAYNAERWADEEAARAVGDRRLTARAVARAALLTPEGPPLPGVPAFAAGPVPRRVAALLEPVPPSRGWPPAASRAGLAAYLAAAGTTVSAASSLNAALALFLVLKAATPL